MERVCLPKIATRLPLRQNNGSRALASIVMIGLLWHAADASGEVFNFLSEDTCTGNYSVSDSDTCQRWCAGQDRDFRFIPRVDGGFVCGCVGLKCTTNECLMCEEPGPYGLESGGPCISYNITTMEECHEYCAGSLKVRTSFVREGELHCSCVLSGIQFNCEDGKSGSPVHHVGGALLLGTLGVMLVTLLDWS